MTWRGYNFLEEVACHTMQGHVGEAFRQEAEGERRKHDPEPHCIFHGKEATGQAAEQA